jgi:hypothetical protein
MKKNIERAVPKVQGTLYLEVSARLCMDPRELVEKYHGRLVMSAGSGDCVAGKTQYWVVRVQDMLERGIDPVAAMDWEDNDTAAFCRLFADSREDWSKAVYSAHPDAMFGDLAILDRLIVNPPFRGKKIGLHCIEMMRRIIGGMGLFVLNPVPLQHNAGYANDPSVAREAKDKVADRRKLMAYYEVAGFRKVPGTELMALDPRTLKRAIPWMDEEGDIRLPSTEAMELYRVEREAKE